MIIDKILNDIEINMKARNLTKLTALRTLHAEIKNASINNKKPIDDDMCIDVLSRLVKQKNEAYEIYVKANKMERAESEKNDEDMYKSYLPEQMTEADVKSLISDIISATGASSIKDMGKVMGQLTPKIKGKFDMKMAGQFVKDSLN